MAMKALVVEKATPADAVTLSEIPVPKVKPGWVLVRMRGRGLNHSEQVLRKEEIKYDYLKHLIIPGIEGVGEIVDASDSAFTVGQKVCMLMGGMGREWDGSYVEYCLAPADHVFVLPHMVQSWSWAALAAIPETYFTAWGSLFEGLKLSCDDTLLVRGASCGLGYAALQLAHALGCKVVATTHKQEYAELLKAHGAHEVVIDNDDNLSGRSFDRILELIGPNTLCHSLKLLRPGGICCHTGILGGLEVLNDFDPIKSIPNGCYLTSFFSNYPTQEIMNEIFEFVITHHIQPIVAAEFSFEQLPDAIKLQDKGGFQGKIIVADD